MLHLDFRPLVLNSVKNAVSVQNIKEDHHCSHKFSSLGCGDVSDAAANSPGLSADSDCNIACSGDAIHLCGGENRLQVCHMLLFYRQEHSLVAVLRMEWNLEPVAYPCQYWPIRGASIMVAMTIFVADTGNKVLDWRSRSATGRDTRYQQQDCHG